MTERGSQNQIESSFAAFSVLLVSTLPDFCINLRSAIFRAKKLKSYTLQVHICETVKQVTDSTEATLEVDYVVFGLDMEKPNCIDQSILQNSMYTSSPHTLDQLKDGIRTEITSVSAREAVQVKQDLKLLSNRFFTSGDYCMVISSNVPAFKMGVTWDSLQGLQTTYQMPVINGDTEDEDKCNYLGQRILRLIESVKGMHSGFPLFNASTNDAHGQESIVARRHLAFMDI